VGSRHHSLDYSEVKDVTQLLEDFERHNDVRLTVSFELERTSKGPGIVMSGEAWTSDPGRTEAPLLASASVRCLALNLRHWGAAVTHLLYVLDAQLALKEMQGSQENRA